jgi:hypothetical protein
MTFNLSLSAECSQLEGRKFERFHRALGDYNKTRLQPGLPDVDSDQAVTREGQIRRAEIEYVNAVRAKIDVSAKDVPQQADAFIDWFESLRADGPGQGDPLFPWLEHSCNFEQMKWFLEQEVSGEAGFDDLVALTQVKMPLCAKLEMARNYWDEMGRGSPKGMHGPMLEKLARHLELSPSPQRVVPEAVALGNAMIALAQNRCFAFHSVGALGAIEMTAPTRAGHIARGLKRLGVSAGKLHYFALHSVLDVRHAEAWNREVLHTLVAEDPLRAHAIAEGALIRLWHGQRCFIRYRSEFQLDRDYCADAGRQLCASLA